MAAEIAQAAPGPKSTSAQGQWVLYLLECEGNKFYAGITNNMDKRFAAHCSGKGAKFTRANRPLRILGTRPYADRSSASKGEWKIKQLPKCKKVIFLSNLEACN